MKKIFHLIQKILAKRGLRLVKSLIYLNREKRIDLNRLDYNRLACLEMCGHEIYAHNVAGNVAELGVFKGDFAKDINTVFPDRKLYLFDTFEGFDNRDIGTEVGKGFSTGDQDFSGTSVALVLGKMPHKDNCIVCKGYFPATAESIEDKFAFVSIDTDLYEPILAGLQYFYPRLHKGGYIFVHDYNNEGYKGARQAVLEFCRQQHIAFVPIPDLGGSVVIGK